METKKFETEDSGKHYNREERLSMMSDSLLKSRMGKKGFFRNNKPLVIILADIILICLLFLGFLIYSKLTVNTSSDENYKYSLKGYIFDNTALISLAITNTTSDTINANPEEVEITFTLSDDNSFFKKIFDVMPDNRDREKVFRVSVPVSEQYSGQNPIVYASIKHNSDTTKLKYSLRKEK